MRTAMVGKDKIWSGEVNRHLAREKEFEFLVKLRERKLLPQNEPSEANLLEYYLDGVKNIIEYHWNKLDTIVFCYYLNE